MSKETELVQEQSQEQTVVPSGNPQEILDDVFNINPDNPFTKESVLDEAPIQETTEGTLDTNNQQNDNSHRYWQSQHDKKQAELDEIKSKYADMEEIIPIARHIKRNPELLNVDKETKTEEKALPEVVKPEKPVRPSDFSRSEAMADPDSASAKYLDAQDDYVTSMSEYMLEKETRREQLIQKQQEQNAVIQRDQQTLSDLTSKHGYTPDLANDFMQTMKDPQSLSLDNLVKLHKLNIGMNTTEGTPQQVSPQAQQKQQVMEARQPKAQIPKPIGVTPGQSIQSSTKRTEDNMMDIMMNNHKKDNPFQ